MFRLEELFRMAAKGLIGPEPFEGSPTVRQIAIRHLDSATREREGRYDLDIFRDYLARQGEPTEIIEKSLPALAWLFGRETDQRWRDHLSFILDGQTLSLEQLQEQFPLDPIEKARQRFKHLIEASHLAHENGSPTPPIESHEDYRLAAIEAAKDAGLEPDAATIAAIIQEPT